MAPGTRLGVYQKLATRAGGEVISSDQRTRSIFVRNHKMVSVHFKNGPTPWRFVARRGLAALISAGEPVPGATADPLHWPGSHSQRTWPSRFFTRRHETKSDDGFFER